MYVIFINYADSLQAASNIRICSHLDEISGQKKYKTVFEYELPQEFILSRSLHFETNKSLRSDSSRLNSFTTS